jgi:hypothetical protein
MKMPSKPIKIVAVALALSMIGTAALAQGSMQQQNACRPDVFRLCGNYIPNVGEIVACLRGNEASLSEPCHQVMFPDQAAQDGYERTARIRSGEVQ